MADKAISELVAATQVTPTDLFVLQQSGTAKKLTGQILENWLVSFADGHGGIQSIVKRSTSGLKDTYRITLADTTTFDFTVTNGRSITGVSKVSTSGLVDTHRISYNDGTSSTFTVTNGAKGDPGDTPQVWVRYSSQEPTEASHNFGVLPDDWMGFCSNYDSSAPTDWQAYTWFKIKGPQGDPGNPATVISFDVEYLGSDSGTIIPSGSWQKTVPAIAQGRYLWTRITIRFNTGNPIVAYSVSRYGIDGSGAVSTVNQKSPDSSGNVQLTASDVGALPTTGGAMTGGIDMGGQTLAGLRAPTADTDAASKIYVDTGITGANAYAAGLHVRNLLDNSDFMNPVAQAGVSGKHGTVTYAVDRWILDSGTVSVEAGVGLTLNGTIRQKLEHPPAGTVSAFVGMVSGEASISYENGEVTVTSAGGVLQWAALYEGEYTAETLPPYVPKGYGAELAECQRYYIKLPYVITCSGLVTGGAKNYYMPVSLPVTMRALPTVVSSKGWKGRTSTGYSAYSKTDYVPFTNILVTRFNGSGLTICDSVATAVDTNNTVVAFEINGLELSADL